MMRGGDTPMQSSSGRLVPKKVSRPAVKPPHQHMLLVSKCRSTTQERLSASYNGDAKPFNGDVDLSPKASSSGARSQKQLLRADTGDESCTLKTTVSVGASIESDTLFILSNSSQPLQPTGSSPSRSHSYNERESRKRPHYKAKLRTLAERLAANSAIDWSRRENKSQEDAVSLKTQDDDIGTKIGRICGSMRNNVLACAMTLCVHDAIVDPEGLIISVTRKNFNWTGDEECDVYTENDGFSSEVSSLTDETYHRYQARYRKY